MVINRKVAELARACVILGVTGVVWWAGDFPACAADEKILQYRRSEAGESATSPNLLFLPNSFHRVGTWQIRTDAKALDSVILHGRSDGKRDATLPAETLFTVPKAGKYRIWVRCREFQKKRPGVRFFDVRIGEDLYQERFADEGLHDGYGWENGGIVELPMGEARLQLVDSSAEYVRFDALLLTPDLEKNPSDEFEQVVEGAAVVRSKALGEGIQPPDWAQSDADPIREQEIGNDRVRVRFFETPADGGTVIQKQTQVLHEGRWHASGERTQPLVWAVVFANKSEVEGDFNFGCERWRSSIPTKEGETTVITANIFESGELAWLVPRKIRRLGPNRIELVAGCELGELTVVWSLSESAQEPLVECRFQANRSGSYSLGMFNGQESALEDVDYVLCAKPFLGKFIPQIPVLVRENASPNGCSLMTLPLSDTVGGCSQATFGIAPDPSCVPFRWATEMDSDYGLGICSPAGKVQPWLFAPLPGRPEGELQKGETFTFAYRPLFMIGGWYDMYRHVTDDILEIGDVKKNYYCSLTETIFNLHDLILAEQEHSGWNDKAMAHAYVELARGANSFNHSSPLAMIQNYLFTEDGDWYRKRAIPTLAFMLSRSSSWVVLPYTGEDAGQPTALRKPSTAFPSSVYAGFYRMSRGQIPGYRPYGVPDRLVSWSMGRVRSLFPKDVNLRFLEHLYCYRATGEPAELAEAEKGAKAYIDAFVRSVPKRQIAHVGFEIMGTAPYLPALLSLYETTGKKEYLDAAEIAARRLLAHGVWAQPRIPNGEITFDAEALKTTGFFHDSHYVGACVHGWNGDTRTILGYRFTGDIHGRDAPLVRTEAFDHIRDETVPAWLLSRVGLNVENAGQLSHGGAGFRSPNITMNCYAPDLIRLSEYTGDSFFETVARHDTIARAANYPGYYIDHMSTIYMKPDYPYEGPDVTAIEYTHIPPYLAKIQDFLVTQAWAWSDRQIEFPWIRQYGYAYFDNKIYGFEPGRFFDEEGMWIWLKRGLIEVDNMQVDWLGARREGLFAAALMNEDDHAVEVEVALGKEITGGESFSGQATVYNASGHKIRAKIENGRFSVTVPGKGLIGFTAASKAVEAPRFAAIDLVDLSETDPQQTVASPDGRDDFGTGYVLQIDPDSWFAYTFLPFKPEEIRSAALHYRAGESDWRVREVPDYPFECLEELSNDGKSFSFYWVIKDSSGKERRSREKLLLPLSKGEK